MRILNIFTIAIFAILFTSCSKDEPQLTLIDFSGTYTGELNCIGALQEDSGSVITVVISSTGGDTYALDLGDDVVFNGVQKDNSLIIERQIFNEGGSFDVITFEGDIQPMEDRYLFDFSHSVDDEGESKCDLELTKQ